MSVFFGTLGKSASAVAVIMAGGSGTRFWPLSRKSLPKQYLSLGSGEQSLIQATAERLQPIVGAEGILVVTALAQKALVEAHVPGAAVLAEPVPRNTCPCVGYAAVKILRELGDVPLLCLPADHKIEGDAAIETVYRQALAIAAENDELVTIGIRPTGPETGYGYIRTGARTGDSNRNSFHVEAFVEKPDIETARRYVASGEYFWNSGMFAWRPSVLLRAIEQHVPDLYQKLMRIGECFGRLDERERIEEIFTSISPISVDVAVMEKASNVVMLSGDGFTWNDVGSWSSWVDSVAVCASQAGIDRDGTNVSKGDAMFVNCTGCAAISSGRFVGAIGLKDILVVETDDAVLVCHKDEAQGVKDIVSKLSGLKRESLL